VEAHSQFGHWLNNVSNWLSLKAPHSGLAEEWKSIGTSILLVGSRYYNDKASWNIFRNVVKKRVEWLRKMGGEWNRYAQPSARPAGRRQDRPSRIYVHGPAGPLRDAVFAFLKKLNLPSFPPPHESRETKALLQQGGVHFSQIAHVIVLFARGPSQREAVFGETAPEADPLLQSALELGFFMGKIGAKRTCALAENGVSLPLDFSEALFIGADAAGAWQIALARGLKGAGIALDMNRGL